MVAEGDIVVAKLPQSDGKSKLRPVLLVRRMPGHGDYLCCGISAQLHHEQRGFDVVLEERDPAFKGSGLLKPSLFRLNFLATIPESHLTRLLGSLPTPHLRSIQATLSAYLVEDKSNGIRE